jgi:DNA-binding LacI/PurR family transcriptional regulator
MKMSDLAKIAGVSKSTVSRALAGSDLINKETQEHIRALAKKHGYRKDMRASNFRMKQMLTIGVLLPSDGTDSWLAENPFILEMLGAISDELELKGHELLLAKHSNSDPSWIKDFIENRSVDGIIVLGQSVYHDIINEAALNCKNLIVWGAHLPEQNYIAVGSDNYLGGKLAAKHLLSGNKKKLAFLGNIKCPEPDLRYLGFKETIIRAGLPEPILIKTEESRNSVADNFGKFLRDGHKIDGLFAANDLLALSAIQIAQDNKMNVPNDLAVIGYDDISLLKYINPSITSVSQDRKIAGKLLIDKLMAIMSDEDATREFIPTELIIRDSSK